MKVSEVFPFVSRIIITMAADKTTVLFTNSALLVVLNEIETLLAVVIIINVSSP